MLPDEVRAGLEEFKAELARSFGERFLRAVLFGSYARATAHADSDIDVLVLVAERQPKDGHRAVDGAVAVMLRRPEVVISPLVMTPEELADLRRRELRLALDIDREGIAL